MLRRRDVVQQLVQDRPDSLLAVSSLGSSTWDLTAAGDDPRNFCFIGAMGQAAPFALGLSIAQPDKRVLLIAGDGEMLMGLGALATIANQAPSNLSIVVLDNESYVETGSQPTATAGPTDLEAIARGCGIADSRTITEDSEIAPLVDSIRSTQGPIFAVIKINAEALPLAFPYSFDGAVAMNRFRDSIVKA